MNVKLLMLMTLSLLAASAVQAAQFRLNVVDGDGAPVAGFRWVLQEDTTFPVDPANPSTNPDELLSLGFHASNQPIARAQGSGQGLSGNTDLGEVNITTVPPGRYYVSVLPYSGYSISGAPVNVLPNADDPGQTLDNVTVTVESHPIPTAQIALYLFHDNHPINGAPDLPEETNPAFGEPGHVDWSLFNVILEEPAGRYGVAGGQVIQDAFGNPLGTSYLPNCDGYDPACIDTLGDGTIQPQSDGTLLIKNLAPGKYGVVVIPPTGSNWQQTTTIEGTKVIDAWVKANEPAFFVEFGPPGPHVFMGFVQPFSDFPAANSTATLSGTITDMHMSRSPTTQFFSGRAFPNCWVGVNEANPAGLGRGLYAGPCDGDSNFNIANVPPGSYQLKVFDANLDAVIASQGFTVDDDGRAGYANGNCNGGTTTGCDFGEVAVFNWFTRLNTGIFNDLDQDGFWDANETGIGPESQENILRWRDGTIYQAFPTDGDGLAPFDEVFPFFHWLVAETSFGNKKATGATFVTDAGGLVDKTLDVNGELPGFPGFGELTPLAQFEDDGVTPLPDCDANPLAEVCTTDGLSRTERGPVLTAATQGFLGQTSVMHFGKTDYVNFDWTANPPTYVGENGGISGLVYYATTRAEDEPQYAAAEEWEPGVPRVQVNLYADGDIDSFPLDQDPTDGWQMSPGDVDWNEDGVRDLDDDVIDDVNGDGVVTLSDVDNYPLGNFPGVEDTDRNGNGIFDLGDAVQVTWTDSWDDNLPTGCQGANNLDLPGSPYTPPPADNRCFDGLRNFNQVRPGVFDGGYAFADYDLDHLESLDPAVRQGSAAAAIRGFYAAVNNSNIPNKDKLQLGLIPGDYIVEAATPPGYKLMKEEDKNVDFGDEYVPSERAFAPTCVGELRDVPPYLSMTTKDGSGSVDQLIPGIDPVDAAAPFAGDGIPESGDERPLCDRKRVTLSAAQNAAAEFWVMTDVPIAGNISGVILNDLGNEFNPNSPAFGEKYAPPNVPVGFYDWNGNEVNRVYADTNGRYNLVVPSTFTANLPQPSGMSPNMLVSCMNDAGTGPLPDPYWNPSFSQFCYTFQYMPGAITYLDTPVEPIAAFASPITYPVDCERPATTPMIASVTRNDMMGPYVIPGETILIDSMGLTEVDNPDWDGTTATARKITRDYSFAAGCTAALEDEDGVIVKQLTVDSCAADQVVATVPADTDPGAYQVVVTNNPGPDAIKSPIGLTLTVDETDPLLRTAVWRVPGDFTTIQGAIDSPAVGASDIILVGPKGDGTQYDELVIMWKPVKLQGWGVGAVTINARQVPTEKVADWRAKVSSLLDLNLIDRLPGQEAGLAAFPALAAAVFPTEEGAAIFVAGKETGLNRFGRKPNRGARIDGFNIIGASTGGGIVVNGYAQFLEISNNRIIGNAGAYGGGIRIGHPDLAHEDVETGELVYDDAVNDQIQVHHNHIAKNGGRGGAGGGLSLHTGADAYKVKQNWICGNFSSGSGGGIGHLGLSNRGVIADNMILFNESFAQAGPRSGGGIFISGQPGLETVVSPGSGGVTIDSNVIRGNLAGAGDGGGIMVNLTNGVDVEAEPDTPSLWYRINLYNNMINNNVAGLAGGGVALQDAVRVFIRNNTVAHNESTATTALAFAPDDPNMTNATPAGIVGRSHTLDFDDLMSDPNVNVGGKTTLREYSDPVQLRDNIVDHNRSFYWLNHDDLSTATIETGLYPSNCPPGGTGTPDDPYTAPTNCNLADAAAYTADLGLMDGSFTKSDVQMNPRFSLLTLNLDNLVYLNRGGNTAGDPAFVHGYFNGGLGNLDITEFTTLSTAGAFDEGGNFIQVAYSPLSLVDSNSTTGDLFDYHITAGSAAIDAGGVTPATGYLSVDIDNEPRPTARGESDIGADEVLAP